MVLNGGQAAAQRYPARPTLGVQSVNRFAYQPFKFLFGGGARNDKLSQVKADILEREIRALTISETGALAAALLAGHAIGIYGDIGVAVDHLIKPRKVFTPSAENRDLYRALYAVYKKLYPALREVHSELSGL